MFRGLFETFLGKQNGLPTDSFYALDCQHLESAMLCLLILPG